MPNRTQEFLEVCSQQHASSSSVHASGSSGKPGNAPVSEALRKHRKRKREAAAAGGQQQTTTDVNDPDVDVWTLEATRVAASLRSLSLFLASIRRAYLDLSSSTSATSSSSYYHQHHGKGKGPAGGKGARGELDLSKGLLEAWKDVKWLDDRERDEVDWQAKTQLRRCIERLRELETAEKNRHATAIQHLGSLPTNGLSRLLGLPALQLNKNQASEEALHAHRQQVTLYLSRRLADVSRIQKDQQELRVNRQLEQQSMNAMSSLVAGGSSTSKSNKGAGDEEEGGIPAIFVPDARLTGSGLTDDDDDEEPPIDSLLSPEQIQQFESESSQLLQEANTQLAAIEKAQASLLEISSLQSELTIHLTQQMELTDKLWEDSVLVTGRVEEGNKQLKEARERSKEGRLWLLIFLLGASFSLLFLEYY